ncbi:hypothetical protein pmac_cds_51 [Pandoravirus macleodensis]|uniref:Uncharacterized protein n=1 Tax=Pandoravirus macleodensis TaxID=2107707 RepID=A0A2U7UE39_9VIRU|nr:hypothetical protein pmac_cds_51 [Pandoravirus macleodensis]AVK76739.1 hypothetical protein pmac_cds_51 [Pandoravirus macleodensis]
MTAMAMMATTAQGAMAMTHEAKTAAALGKRPLEQYACDGDGQLIDRGNASPKRLRCDSPAPPALESDGLFVWDGIECDPEDIACRDRIAFVAIDDASPLSDLVAVLPEATVYQIELAMLHVFSSGIAFSRMCRALASMPSLSRSLNLEALVYRAAHENRPGIVATMLYRLCEEGDVERALLTAVEENDPIAVEAIDMACRNDANTSGDSHQSLARGALYEAVQSGRVTIVAYLAGVCNHDAIQEALSMCVNAGNDDHLDDSDDDEDDEDEDAKGRAKSAKNDAQNAAAKTAADVFAALWEHADLCAHDYIATLSPCPIRDYLADRITQGEPCADGCMTNLPDDSDEEDEDEEDVDDDSTTDDGGRCNDEDGDTQNN